MGVCEDVCNVVEGTLSAEPPLAGNAEQPPPVPILLYYTHDARSTGISAADTSDLTRVTRICDHA